MKLFRFDARVGHEIGKFDSVQFILSTIAHLKGEALVSCIHLGENGVAGNHQTITPQLMLVVQGEGLVRAEKEGPVEILPGIAVFWEKGEWHETSTASGLMAIIIECELLNPAEYMPPATPGEHPSPGRGINHVR
jgi:mannose-6-phosphate isomerase-like protein (cupin superfamily)